MKTTAITIGLLALVGLIWAAVLPNLQISVSTPEANADDGVYLGNYVTRIYDTELGVTCYVRGPSGISCLKFNH